MSHEYNKFNAGIDREDIDDVLKHIRRSSYYVRISLFLEKDLILACAPAFAIFALIVFAVSSYFGVPIIFVFWIIVLGLILTYIVFPIVLYRYLVSYAGKPVNQETFNLIVEHRPTTRFIYSGHMCGKTRNDLTNTALLSSYKNLSFKKNEIQAEEGNT